MSTYLGWQLPYLWGQKRKKKKRKKKLSKPASSLQCLWWQQSWCRWKKEQEEQISTLPSHCLVRFGCWASWRGCFLLLPSPQDPVLLKLEALSPQIRGGDRSGQPKARRQAAFSNMLSGAANIYYLFGSLPPDLRDESDVLRRKSMCHGVCPGRRTRPVVPWPGPVQLYSFSLQQGLTLGLRAFHSFLLLAVFSEDIVPIPFDVWVQLLSLYSNREKGHFNALHCNSEHLGSSLFLKVARHPIWNKSCNPTSSRVPAHLIPTQTYSPGVKRGEEAPK